MQILHPTPEKHQRAASPRAASPDVKDDDFGGVHENGGHVAGVLLVPPQAQQGCIRLRAVVDYRAVLLVPAI